MDFVAGGAGINVGGVGENGPILYSEPNRTSAIDDLRSVVIYIFIITIFVGFFLILPGIRNDKFPTFLCITTSLIVTSIILVSLFGTTWHQGDAPISAAYKAFSRDRIQGDLSVMIGLQSVNITLRAQKYYILHETDGPIIMDNTGMSLGGGLAALMSQMRPAISSTSASSSNKINEDTGSGASFVTNNNNNKENWSKTDNLADELLADRTNEGVPIDTELEADEAFEESNNNDNNNNNVRRRARSSRQTTNDEHVEVQPKDNSSLPLKPTESQLRKRRLSTMMSNSKDANTQKKEKYTIKRVNIDINYNEQFYWIEPNQMRQEYHNALERGLPYPILTVVEYLSQDEAGFSWSRQYRLAGYYSSIMLWLSLSVCALMFFLHCAAPKYGIYTMQILGCLLLFTNLTYASLVPKGDQRLVIPFEGQSLSFRFGWSFWLVLIGGCLSLIVGTIIVIIDSLFPNFIFTTVLDVDYDSHYRYYKRHPKSNDKTALVTNSNKYQKPDAPPFFNDSTSRASNSSLSSGSKIPDNDDNDSNDSDDAQSRVSKVNDISLRVRQSRNTSSNVIDGGNSSSSSSSKSRVLSQLFVEPSMSNNSDNNVATRLRRPAQIIPQSSVVHLRSNNANVNESVAVDTDETKTSDRFQPQQVEPKVVSPHNGSSSTKHHHQTHHYYKTKAAATSRQHLTESKKNASNLKGTDHQTLQVSGKTTNEADIQQVRL